MQLINLQGKHESMYEAADRLRGEYSKFGDLIVAIGRFIHEHARSVPNRKKIQSIIESRFTPAEEAYEKGMMSCGVVTNISSEMLKHLGYKVRFVHGECKQAVDHAWISILNPEDNTWREYDLTRADGSIPETHIKKQEVSSWEDIKEQIFNDHETLSGRQRERGI